MQKEEISPSLAQAQRLKQYSHDGKLSADVIDAIMTEGKAEPAKLAIPGNKLKKYFPPEFSQSQMESVIFQLLENWKNRNE
jgi:ParB family chromosome partitioning protein